MEYEMERGGDYTGSGKGDDVLGADLKTVYCIEYGCEIAV